MNIWIILQSEQDIAQFMDWVEDLEDLASSEESDED